MIKSARLQPAGPAGRITGPTTFMKQRSIRIAMPEVLYEKLKLVAPEHGDISKLVRDLLLKYIAAAESN